MLNSCKRGFPTVKAVYSSDEKAVLCVILKIMQFNFSMMNYLKPSYCQADLNIRKFILCLNSAVLIKTKATNTEKESFFKFNK